MRIGIDLYGFDPDYSGGVSTFVLGLTNGLLNNLTKKDIITIFISEKNEKQLRSSFDKKSVSFVKISVSKWYRYFNRALWLLSWVLQNFKLRFWFDKYFRSRTMRMIDESIDILISPATVLNFFALEKPTVLCVHDIQQEYHPEFFTFNQLILRWAAYRLSCWRAAAIQVSSIYIQDCLIEKYLFIKPDKIFVAHEGVDLEKFSTQLPGERPESIGQLERESFVFYPAQLWPHKNHMLLVYALSNFLEKTGNELPCVLTGYDYGYWEKIKELINKHHLKQIYYLGRVSFNELLWLYQNCSAVLALGLHESSSLPVREGAVFGKPLICSNIPPNIETQEFLNLNIVDKNDSYELSETCVALVENRDALYGASIKNVSLVKVFDWNQIAKKYILEINSVCRHKDI